MKKTFLNLLLIGSVVCYSQTYTLDTHPMYSSIWEKKYEIVKTSDGTFDTTSYVTPKNGGKFKILTVKESDSIFNLIDTVFIRDNLIPYLNLFRSDYGVNPVLENPSLVVSSNEHSVYLMEINKLVHSTHPSKRFEEAVVFVPFGLFSRVTKEDGDINKLILEGCFDIFIGSPAHTAILLNKDPVRTFAVGVCFVHSGYYVVVQSIVE